MLRFVIFGIIMALMFALQCYTYTIIMSASERKLSVVGRNIEVSEPLQAYADAKLSKQLKRHDNMLEAVSLQLKVENRGGGLHDVEHIGYEAHVAEVTVTCKDRHIIRASSETEDM